MAKEKSKTLGAWAFLVGVILALVLGILNGFNGTEPQSWAVWILILAGIVVGIFNVTDKESYNFLLASLALVIVSSLGGNVIEGLKDLQYIGPMLQSTLVYLLILFVPTTIIVALKSVFDIAKD